MNNNKTVFFGLVASILLLPAINARAASILVSQCVLDGADCEQGYGYGGSSWTGVSGQLDALNDVTVASDFSNTAQVLAADALWLDQRWTDGSLGVLEIANIEAFIAAGGRVVMFGDNDLWSLWNTQILATVGGTYDAATGGTATATGSHELLTGVSQVQLDSAGQANGGNALFDIEFMTVWGISSNVVTVLDVNFLADSNLAQADNQQLAGNLVSWVSGATIVPVPPALLLLFSALATLRFYGRYSRGRTSGG